MLSNNLIELDRNHLIHPVASWRGHEAAGARVIASAKGATMIDGQGRKLLDGFSGLWCVNAGYGQPSVIAAATAQMESLSYATGYFGLSAEPTIRLASRLAELAPGDIDHVFFTLGGSDAVDSTVRFARHYWFSRGMPQKDQFISLEMGYHGSSTTGSGLTALPAFHAGFGMESQLQSQHKIPSHMSYRNPVGSAPADIIAASVAQLKSKIDELGAERVAAFYAEPIQGSGGVLVPPDRWIKAMQTVCKEYDVLFVVDEVITAFGRTGPMFASSEEGIVPDMITTAKGLTSGYVPMGAVLMSDRIYQVIADGAGAGPVGHGFTYSGHPVSAAVALAVLDLYEQGGLLENGRAMGERLQAGLHSLSDHPLVGDVRGRGMLAAIELVTDKEKKTALPPEAQSAVRLFDRAWDNNLMLRAFPWGVLGYAPALCCTAGEIDQIIERTRRVLDLTLNDPEVRAAMA